MHELHGMAYHQQVLGKHHQPKQNVTTFTLSKIGLHSFVSFHSSWVNNLLKKKKKTTFSCLNLPNFETVNKGPKFYIMFSTQSQINTWRNKKLLVPVSKTNKAQHTSRDSHVFESKVHIIIWLCYMEQ